MTFYPRARPRHATANDGAIEAAAIAAIAETGWDAANVVGVSERAGLTSGAFYTRFPALTDLALSLWEAKLGDGFAEAVTDVAGSVSSREDLAAALERWAQPDDALLRAALELIQAAQFEPGLAPIREAAQTLVDGALVGGGVPAAQVATALSLAMGLSLTSTRSRVAALDLGLTLPDWAAAVTSPTAGRDLPEESADHLRQVFVDTGDARHDQMLAAALEVIGERGYRNASISRICRSSGATTGYLYDRYPGKLELFLAASKLTLDGSYERTFAFGSRLTEIYDPVIAEAVVWREVQMPDLVSRRRVLMEQGRMAQFDQRMSQIQEEQEETFLSAMCGGRTGTELAAARARWHVEIGLGLGLNLLSLIATESWSLPYDAVIEPLLARGLLQQEPST